MRKKFIFALGTVLSVALSAAQAFGAVYYVATDGSDSAAGSKDKPFATLNKANKVVHAGDTVWIRGGIYDLHDTVFFEQFRGKRCLHRHAPQRVFTWAARHPWRRDCFRPTGPSYQNDKSSRHLYSALRQ